MKKVLIALAFVGIAVAAHAAGCLVFDATAPKTLADGSVVYPLSDVFPKIVPIANCSSASGLIADSSKFIAVDISATCHPVLVKAANFQVTKPLPDKVAGMVKPQPARYTTVGLFADRSGNCGPLAPAATKQAQWSNY